MKPEQNCETGELLGKVDEVRLNKECIGAINSQLENLWGCENLEGDLLKWNITKLDELLAETVSFLGKVVAFCREVTNGKLSKELAGIGLSSESEAVWITLVGKSKFDEAVGQLKPFELRKLELDLFKGASQSLGEKLCKIIVLRKGIADHDVEFKTNVGDREKLEGWMKEIKSYPPQSQRK